MSAATEEWPTPAPLGSPEALADVARRRDDHGDDDERLLDDVRAWFARYVATMTLADLDLLALWAVHTHVAVETYTTPRLQLDSPVPSSGKTTTMEHLQRLCANAVLMAAVSSSALLVRMLEAGPRTLLIDEADRSLRPDKPETADVIAVLNSGYKRGATRPVLVPVKGGGWESREMATFAPVALAGNAPNLPADTATRTLRVLLMPDVDNTVEESDWELIEPDAEALAARIVEWCDTHRDTIRGNRPSMPDGVTGRFREKWQPLARVAAVAGGRWPAAVAAMARADVEQVALDREDGMIADRPHVVLLRHVADVWPEGEAFVPTAQLVGALVATWPQVWSVESAYGKDLTAQRFGRMLAAGYKVHSRQDPDPPRTRGYALADLLPAWRRMGVHPPQGTVPAVPAVRTVPQPEDVPSPEPTPNGSNASNGSNGSNERAGSPVRLSATACVVCGQPLPADPRLRFNGAHATCAPDESEADR